MHSYFLGSALRTRAKHIVERSLVLCGLPMLRRVRHRHDVLILSYHNIVPSHQWQGDTSLHLPLQDFVEQIDALSRTHDVVPLASLFEAGVSARRPRVVITFDDAYSGALTLGIPQLLQRGMPATIFVAPGILGRRTWWDTLADPAVGAVPELMRHRALTEFAGEGEAVLSAMSDISRQRTSSLRIATEQELRAALPHTGIAVGSHSWTHSNLTALESDAVNRELRSSMEWLSARFPASFVPWLSYPYGLASEIVERAAAATGFVGAVRVGGGWIGAAERMRRHELPRFNVPCGLSKEGFRLATAS